MPALYVHHVGADLLHAPHRLVAQDVALVHEGAHHLVEMQVRAADADGHDLDDRVGGMLDARVGHGVHADIALAVECHCLHRSSPSS
jgi:hypothetical protein